MRSVSTIREDMESHFATHPCPVGKRTVSRLTLPLCQVRKGPPRTNVSGCHQENMVFLHSLRNKALLERNSKGATQNPIECANGLIWRACLKETFCGETTVETVPAQVQ